MAVAYGAEDDGSGGRPADDDDSLGSRGSSSPEPEEYGKAACRSGVGVVSDQLDQAAATSHVVSVVLDGESNRRHLQSAELECQQQQQRKQPASSSSSRPTHHQQQQQQQQQCSEDCSLA
jgi:hypothetical protein